MRDDLDPVIREQVPEDLKARVAAKVAPSLARNKERAAEGASSWAWLLKPAMIGGLAAAGVAAVVVVSQQPQRKSGGDEVFVATGPVQYELEMLANAELLDDLEMLENWEKVKKESAAGWKKKKG